MLNSSVLDSNKFVQEATKEELTENIKLNSSHYSELHKSLYNLGETKNDFNKKKGT